MTIHISHFHYLQGRKEGFPLRAEQQSFCSGSLKATSGTWRNRLFWMQESAVFFQLCLHCKHIFTVFCKNAALNTMSICNVPSNSRTILGRFNWGSTKYLVGSSTRAASTTNKISSVDIGTWMVTSDLTQRYRRTTSQNMIIRMKRKGRNGRACTFRRQKLRTIWSVTNLQSLF